MPTFVRMRISRHAWTCVLAAVVSIAITAPASATENSVDNSAAFRAERAVLRSKRSRGGTHDDEVHRGDRDVSGDFRYTRSYVKRDGRWQDDLTPREKTVPRKLNEEWHR